MKYSFECPHCGRRITVSGTKHVGSRKPCPSCQKPLTIPAPPVEEGSAEDTDAPILGEIVSPSTASQPETESAEPNFDFGMDLPPSELSETPVQSFAQTKPAFGNTASPTHPPSPTSAAAPLRTGGRGSKPPSPIGNSSRSRTFWIVGGIAAAAGLFALFGIVTLVWWMTRDGSGGDAASSIVAVFRDGYPNDDGKSVMFDTPGFRDVVWREARATGMSDAESQELINDYRTTMSSMAKDFGVQPDSNGNYPIPKELMSEDPTVEQVRQNFTQFGLEAPQWCSRLLQKLEDGTIEQEELKALSAAGLLKLLREQS